MAYFPKNKVTTNLYTNGGEFFIQGTSNPYIGYYHKFSTGEIFTGQNPNVSNTRPLVKTPTTTPNQITNLPYTVVVVNSKENQGYIKTKKVNTDTLQTLPTPFYPQPTSNDYQIGEFQRYFARKINEPSFTEISQDTYNKMFNQDSNILYSLYTICSLPWLLVGDKTQVENTNRNIILYTEATTKVYGLNQFLKNKLEFYQGG